MGDPLERDPLAVAEDVNEGYVSVAGAERDYQTGVKQHDGAATWTVDVASTAQLRNEERERRRREARLADLAEAPKASRGVGTVNLADARGD